MLNEIPKTKTPTLTVYFSSEILLYLLCIFVMVFAVILYYYTIQSKKSKENTKFGVEEEILPNVAFYCNQIRSEPDGEHIKTILTEWRGDYYTLEKCHTYIQWLFPNRTPGVNPHAHILQDEEAQIIRETPELRERVKRAFEMMLDFYGMRLTHEDQFIFTENSEERLKELNTYGNHNFRRISRILLGLKEFGHEDLMLPWMKFLADLIYRRKCLTAAKSSFETFWFDILDAEDKKKLMEYKNEIVMVEYRNRQETTKNKRKNPTPNAYKNEVVRGYGEQWDTMGNNRNNPHLNPTLYFNPNPNLHPTRYSNPNPNLHPTLYSNPNPNLQPNLYPNLNPNHHFNPYPEFSE